VIILAGQPLLDRDETKTRTKRRVAVGAGTLELLRARRVEQAKKALASGVALAPDSYVFSHVADGSKPIRPDGISHRFAALAKDLGIQCRLHDLRHFMVTQLISAGWTCAPSPVGPGTATAAGPRWGPTRTSRPPRTEPPPS
jgi:integrase